MESTLNERDAGSVVEADPRWAAVVKRDRNAEDSFYYSVKTTGVYCRPSCAARRPQPEHVAFHATPSEAEQAGFRACKRCKPNQPALRIQQAAAVAKVCRLLEASERAPALQELAAEAGLSPHHLHRVFRAITGVTPRAYANALRAKKLRESLLEANTVTEAIYEAGFGSGAAFYATSGKVLGMTPSAFRSGGENATIRFAVGTCSLGAILVAQSEKGVCAVLLGDDPDPLRRQLESCFPRATLLVGEAAMQATVAQVIAFVEQPAGCLDLPLDIRGTAFQQRVWHALRNIAPGEKVSYTGLAERLGAPKAARAVAQACAANVLAVAIPCHRVVRSDHALSGYRWGVERKRQLLEREALADEARKPSVAEAKAGPKRP